MAQIDLSNQIYGRRKLVTNRQITGDINGDLETVKLILSDVMSVHETNQTQEMTLFNIFVNKTDWWSKDKVTREDINNKVSIPNAWALSRTINGYCFGEPVKFIARGSDETESGDAQTTKQAQVEVLSEMLDRMGNHDSDIMATMCASICGVGYKLALPANNEELELNGIPFVINTDIIMPMLAGVVYSNESISRPVMGFIIGTYYNEEGKADGNLYTCWTKYAQYMLKDSESGDGYDTVKQKIGEKEVDVYQLSNKRIPLIEVERNPFRKGDWEVATELLELKNNLISNRMDDIQQMVDYILVLTNCAFENEDDKKQALQARLLELKVANPNNPSKAEILKNALDQTSIQQLADYIDLLIQECVGIPNRQERGGGGGDTGQAVKYRNGFRDLENNAGLIIPKMDKAELQFIDLCLSYCENVKVEGITDLKARDVRCKFLRSFNDDALSASQAFINLVNGGMDYVNACICSGVGTDPSEINKKILEAWNNGTNFLSLNKGVGNANSATATENAESTDANDTNSQKNSENSTLNAEKQTNNSGETA
jgi:SPP1 family phage portal protein